MKNQVFYHGQTFTGTNRRKKVPPSNSINAGKTRASVSHEPESKKGLSIFQRCVIPNFLSKWLLLDPLDLEENRRGAEMSRAP